MKKLECVKWSLRVFVAGTLLFGASPLRAADKEGKNKARAVEDKENKLDVSDLESKYWAARDTDYNVVQNRLYGKAGRLALSFGMGMYTNEPWSEGFTYNGTLNYFFSERYGIEVSNSKTDSRDNAATANLKLKQGGAPNHNKMKNFYGAAFNWVPFYAKVSVLSSAVMYFDMSISPGVGMVTYEQQLIEGGQMKSAPAFTLDITQHFFLSRYLAIRFDYKNRWYSEDVASYQVSGRSTSSQINNTSIVMGGITLYY